MFDVGFLDINESLAECVSAKFSYGRPCFWWAGMPLRVPSDVPACPKPTGCRLSRPQADAADAQRLHEDDLTKREAMRAQSVAGKFPCYCHRLVPSHKRAITRHIERAS